MFRPPRLSHQAEPPEEPPESGTAVADRTPEEEPKDKGDPGGWESRESPQKNLGGLYRNSVWLEKYAKVQLVGGGWQLKHFFKCSSLFGEMIPNWLTIDYYFSDGLVQLNHQ